jgi:hypothetical protein
MPEVWFSNWRTVIGPGGRSVVRKLSRIPFTRSSSPISPWSTSFRTETATIDIVILAMDTRSWG